MVSPDASDQLRGAGLRVTAPRQPVLRWLAEHPPTPAHQIRPGVAQQLGSVSTQAVYDVATTTGYVLDEAEVVFWGGALVATRRPHPGR